MADANRRPRATRYAIECVMRFRRNGPGPQDWRAGTLKNISETGLLFEPASGIADGVDLEMSIPLPSPAFGSIACTATVVRRHPGTSLVGARIIDSRLERLDLPRAGEGPSPPRS